MEITMKVLGAKMYVSNVFKPLNRDYTVADGNVYLMVEIQVPNRKISGDVRRIKKEIRVGLTDFIVEPGDEIS